jgi:hypothetical protein
MSGWRWYQVVCLLLVNEKYALTENWWWGRDKVEEKRK